MRSRSFLFILFGLAGTWVGLGADEPTHTAPSDGARRDEPGVPSNSPRTNEKAPDWQLTVGTTNADGTKSVSASLLADKPITSGFSEVTPKLVLRYRGGKLAVFVVFDTFLGEGELPMTVVFGHEPPEVQSWTISGDGRAAFAPGDAFAWIEKLKHAESLELSFTPPHRERIVVTFTPRDTEALVKALLSAGVKYGT